MRLSQLFMPTLKEAPADAHIDSHKLMLRAGMIRQSASGIYSYLPLGYKVLRKMEEIIREEMDKAGSQETLFPVVQSRELWEQTGRWDDFGPEMFKIKDRHGRDFVLGPTQEEIFAETLKGEVTSFRQLPLNLYHIQLKYRDEKRPRFGVIRSREFIMKDAYSFDLDPKGMEKSFEDMRDAYVKIFDRMDLDYKIVKADSGAMGGSGSEEFIAISEVGEGVIAYTEDEAFAANSEKAEVYLEINDDSEEKELEKIETPNVRTVEELSEFVNLPLNKLSKTMVYETDHGEAIIAIIPGHRQLNETKLFNAAKLNEFEVDLASDELIEKVFNSTAGSLGPIGLQGNYRLYIDSRVTKMKNTVVGGNETGYHYINVNYGRDFDGIVVDDLLEVEEGDLDPVSKKPLHLDRGIEVGHIFQLGTKYSDSLGLTYSDENQKENPVYMGSYGIGVTRTIAAVIEQYNDENGIIWPLSVAPYQIIITMINNKDEAQLELGEKLYKELQDKGYEVLLDDRRERPGVKFNDRDLIGIPLRITVGRDAKDNIVEFSTRKEGVNENLPVEEAITKIENIINSEIDRGIF